MEFRERLYQLRRQAGLSQEELANIMDVSRQAVQKWESGASKPDMDNLTALADYFNVTLDYLIRGSENVPVQNVQVVYPWGYEYKSARTLFGLPLVHINAGYGLRWARGILAIGNCATGVVALGGFSAGLLSLGGIAAGALVFGGIALGGAAIGGLAVGVLALGGVSLGVLSIGACAIGRYAAGASALGSSLAVGAAAASSGVEVGVDVSGRAALSVLLEPLWESGASLDQVTAQIAPAAPHTPEWLIRLLLRLGGLS